MKTLLMTGLAVALLAASPALAQQAAPAGARFATAVPPEVAARPKPQVKPLPAPRLATAGPANVQVERPRPLVRPLSTSGGILVGNNLVPLVLTKRTAPKPKPQVQPVAKLPLAPKVVAVAPAALPVATAMAMAIPTEPVIKPQHRWAVSGINSLQHQPPDEELFQVLAYADRNGGLKDPKLEKDGVRQGYLEDQANPNAPLSERRRQVMIYYVQGTDGSTGMVMRAGENFTFNKTSKR